MTLLDLPEDVLIETCNYFDTWTLWKLMVSCKLMYKLVECRTIWVNQLNRLSSEYAIVGGTYDVHSMSTSEIRKAAIRPYRFELAVQFEEIKPVRYRTTIENEFVQLGKLTPGGRWLVTLSAPRWSEQGPKFCRVWDLHSKAQIAEPCASYPIEQEDFGPELVLRPDSDGKTFQVIFAARRQRAPWRIYILQFDHLNQVGHPLSELHVFEAPGHGAPIQFFGNYVMACFHTVHASEINPGSATMYKTVGNVGGYYGYIWLALGPEGFALFDNAKAQLAFYGPMVTPDLRDSGSALKPLFTAPVPEIEGCDSSPDLPRYRADITSSFGGIRGSSAVVSMHLPTNKSFYIEFKDSPLQVSDLRVFGTNIGYHALGHAKTIDGLVVVVDGPFNLTIVFEDGQMRSKEIPRTVQSEVPLDSGTGDPFICPIGGVVGSVVRDNEIWIWRTD